MVSKAPKLNGEMMVRWPRNRMSASAATSMMPGDATET